VCAGFVCDEAGLPSPKFQLNVVEPVLVFVKLTFNGVHPDDAEVEKAAFAAAETVSEIVVSSLHNAVVTVSVTEYVPAEE
jgi:hypothetical protein